MASVQVKTTLSLMGMKVVALVLSSISITTTSAPGETLTSFFPGRTSSNRETGIFGICSRARGGPSSLSTGTWNATWTWCMPRPWRTVAKCEPSTRTVAGSPSIRMSLKVTLLGITGRVIVSALKTST